MGWFEDIANFGLGGFAHEIEQTISGSRAAAAKNKGLERAAEIEAGALRESTAAQTEMFNKLLAENKASKERELELQQPFRDVGLDALGQLKSQLGAPLEETEAYKFRIGQEEKTINRALAARGLFNSGRAIGSLAESTGRITGEEVGRRDRLLGLAANIGTSSLGLGVGSVRAGSQTSTQLGLGLSGAMSNQALGLGQIGSDLELGKGIVESERMTNLTDLLLQGGMAFASQGKSLIPGGLG